MIKRTPSGVPFSIPLEVLFGFLSYVDEELLLLSISDFVGWDDVILAEATD